MNKKAQAENFMERFLKWVLFAGLLVILLAGLYFLLKFLTSYW